MPNATSPITGSSQATSVDDAIHLLGQALAIFDPFRFRAWAELGLTTAQLRVMFLLRQAPGVTAGELASRLGVTPPTISGIVDRLVKLDLVRREDDEADRRLVRNRLSDAGERACSVVERGGDIFMGRIISEMTPKDLAAFSRGLQAFICAREVVSRVEPNLVEVALPREPAAD